MTGLFAELYDERAGEVRRGFQNFDFFIHDLADFND
jgi:hypothetical protein